MQLAFVIFSYARRKFQVEIISDALMDIDRDIFFFSARTSSSSSNEITKNTVIIRNYCRGTKIFFLYTPTIEMIYKFHTLLVQKKKFFSRTITI